MHLNISIFYKHEVSRFTYLLNISWNKIFAEQTEVYNKLYATMSLLQNFLDET